MESRRVVVETKRWYESRVLWFNAIGFVIGVLSLTEFMAVIPQSWGPYIAAVIAVGNFALRYFTTSPMGPAATAAEPHDSYGRMPPRYPRA